LESETRRAEEAEADERRSRGQLQSQIEEERLRADDEAMQAER